MIYAQPYTWHHDAVPHGHSRAKARSLLTPGEAVLKPRFVSAHFLFPSLYFYISRLCCSATEVQRALRDINVLTWPVLEPLLSPPQQARSDRLSVFSDEIRCEMTLLLLRYRFNSQNCAANACVRGHGGTVNTPSIATAPLMQSWPRAIWRIANCQESRKWGKRGGFVPSFYSIFPD